MPKIKPATAVHADDDGESTCPEVLPLAIVATLVAMVRHWRELPALWAETAVRRG